MKTEQEIAKKEKFKNKLGKKLYNLRKKRGFSLRELGRLAGCSGAYIGLIEKGENAPNIFVLYQIAKALGVSINTFLELNEEINLKENDPIIKKNDFQDYLNIAKEAYLREISPREINNAIKIISTSNLNSEKGEN